jgi:hypothetical protein
LDAGIAYGFSAAAEVIDKYVGEPGGILGNGDPDTACVVRTDVMIIVNLTAPEELPFVVAFTPFDKETGKVKRGKKLKQYYSGAADHAHLTILFSFL